MSEQKKYWTDDPDMVEQFVRGEFSPEERRRLEAEIADCDPCRRLLQEEMETAAGIRRYGRDTVKSEFRKKLGRQQASQVTSFQWIGLAAAVVIIAFGVGLYRIWFGDLQRPTQFRQEIVLTPDRDSAGSINPSAGGDELAGGSAGTSGPSISETRPEHRPADPAPDEIAVNETGTEAPRRESADVVSPSVAAEADAEQSKDDAVNADASAIWLIGEVVMIPHSREITEMKQLRSSEIPAGASPESAAMERSEKEKVRIMAKRTKENSGIILRQAPTEKLPAGRRQLRSPRTNEVEIQLTRSNDGLAVTLYSDVITDAELHDVSVETPADDSLIVTLPNQRIFLHLPAGWNIPAARRR